MNPIPGGSAAGLARALLRAWPHALVNCLAGRASFDDALAATREQGKAEPGRLCELYFYAGEKAQIVGDPGLARQQWQKSVDSGVIEFNEHAMARRRLDAAAAR